MNPQKLFEQVRDLYDQLAGPLSKEDAAHFFGLIADDAETKHHATQNEIDSAAELAFEDEDDDDEDIEDIEDINGESEWSNDEEDED